jgi:CheY-like chemotaxis protein
LCNVVRIRKHAQQTVLIVDDEPIVRESIRDRLREAGYQVATAESGEEALELIRETLLKCESQE